MLLLLRILILILFCLKNVQLSRDLKLGARDDERVRLCPPGSGIGGLNVAEWSTPTAANVSALLRLHCILKVVHEPSVDCG